jgi:2-octaprenyl-6-methoxyphenol hydroxylase
MSEHAVEVVVVGGGPAGLTAALALAAAGVETALIARMAKSGEKSGEKSEEAPDNRTTALVATSITALDTLGVWPLCRSEAAPLRVMRIVDDTGRLWRAPEVRFSAEEIGLDAFGCNIENRHLLAALETRARQSSALARIDDVAEAVEITDAGVCIRCNGGRRVTARLAIGADGAHSLCRRAAGISTSGRRTGQAALTLNLRHGRHHHDISTEFHTIKGPFTLVPLPGQRSSACPGKVETGFPKKDMRHRSSLVLVTDAAEAARLAALEREPLAVELERRSHSILGKLEPEPGRRMFELAIESAQRLAARRVALVGEAAHVMPPIGAQGLNLGLRDAATISELVAAARHEGRDVGAPATTDAYERARRADVMGRMLAVDLLNRSLLSDFLPVQGARGLGLFLAARIAPLRRAAMREGVSPAAARPRLMRGEAF